MNQDPVDAILIGSIALMVLGGLGVVTAIGLIVRDYWRDHG